MQKNWKPIVKKVVKHFETLSDTYKALSEDLQSLLDDDVSRDDPELIPNEQPEKGNKKGEELTEEKMAELKDKLDGFASREEGAGFLKEALKTKTAVERFAKYMEVHGQTKNPKEKIIESIVEATIGARLRTSAIMGK
jgi:hypothetical protein